MPDFREMAQRIKQAADQREAHEEKEREEKDATRNQNVDAAVKSLQSYVLPLLTQAKQEFAKAGVETKIVTDFEVNGFVSKHPSIAFQCISPPRVSEWRYEGATAVFSSSDGKMIEVYIDNRPGERPQREIFDPVNAADVEPLVGKAVEKVLEKYYEGMKDYK